MNPLARITERFHSADRQTRLELLLDYAKKLPDIPERYVAARDQGLGRVPECQSPVFLWLESEHGKLQMHADAPREAPTVRGFVSLLARGVNGSSAAEVEEIPGDLLDRLGIAESLGMMRTQGLSAILGRVKRMAREASS